MERFEATIRDLSNKGMGVADHPDGKVIFVRGAWPGDHALIEIEKTDRRYGFGRVIELLQPSPDRQTPPCPHQGHLSGQCGGCPWMVATYDAQVRAKEKILSHALQRAGIEIKDSILKPTLRFSPTGYRRKAQFRTDGNQIGYLSEHSRDLAPIEDCVVLSDSLRAQFQEIRKQLPKAEWKPTGKYDWNFLEIDETTGGAAPPLNKRLPFVQANSAANEKMKDWVRELIPDVFERTVLELFAGSGNFTEILSELKPYLILAVESHPKALGELERKSLASVLTLKADLTKFGPVNQIKKMVKKPETLFLDPPREGFPMLAEYLEEFPTLSSLIYISCDPFHLARDLRAAISAGFKLCEVQPVDQFPQTPHLETLTVLRRN